MQVFLMGDAAGLVAAQVDRRVAVPHGVYDREADRYVIRTPEDPALRPNREALAWHFDTGFRAA